MWFTRTKELREIIETLQRDHDEMRIQHQILMADNSILKAEISQLNANMQFFIKACVKCKQLNSVLSQIIEDNDGTTV